MHSVQAVSRLDSSAVRLQLCNFAKRNPHAHTHQVDPHILKTYHVGMYRGVTEGGADEPPQHDAVMVSYSPMRLETWELEAGTGGQQTPPHSTNLPPFAPAENCTHTMTVCKTCTATGPLPTLADTHTHRVCVIKEMDETGFTMLQ